jgi:hypothetical protein
MLPFCDWLTVYQTHAQALPVFTAGFRYDTNEEGEVVLRRGKKRQHKGSFETSVNVSCDGHTVYVDGNIGRFGRPDNLWGFTVEECIELASDLVESLGYPRFSGGVQSSSMTSGDFGLNTLHKYVGARIARVDLTENKIVKTNSIHKILRSWSGRKLRRQEFPTQAYEESTTFNYGSKRWNFIAYNGTADKGIHPNNDPELSFLRLELKLRTKYLIDKGLEKITAWQGNQNMSNIVDVIEFHKTSTQLIDACQVTQSRTDLLESLPTRLKAYARNYFDGHDLSKDLPRATFYRIKKQLLEYGIDISFAMNVSRLPIQFEVIQISDAVMPIEYRRETTTRLRNAQIAANDDQVLIAKAV